MNNSQGSHPFSIFEPYSADGFFCALSNRSHGNMSYVHDLDEVVNANRLAFADESGFPLGESIFARCENRTTVFHARKEHAGEGAWWLRDAPRCDAIITNQPDLYLAMMVADCVCVILMDPDKHVVALAHAGYKGVDKRVPVATVQSMVYDYHCSLENIRVAFSPHLKREHCLMEDLNFAEKPEDWQRFIPRDVGTGKMQLAFAGKAYCDLLEAGILPENVEVSTVDTWGKEGPGEYFSHRQSSLHGIPNGRHVVVAGFRAGS